MTQEEIFKLRDSAEQTRVQFKERIAGDKGTNFICNLTF